MAFIRSKTVGGKKYYQLVRNYREAGRHRQEVLCHLGRNDSIEAAIAEVSREEARLREKESKHRRTAEEMEIDILSLFEGTFGTMLPTLSEALKRKRALRERYRALSQLPFSFEEFEIRDDYDLGLDDYYREMELLEDVRHEMRFLRDVMLYHEELLSADWYEEQAKAPRAKLEKLCKCRKEYG